MQGKIRKEILKALEEVKASVRWLARQVCLPNHVVNRAANLLCVLGVLKKVPGSGR